MSYTDIHTYDQHSKALETINILENFKYEMDAPAGFTKMREGGFVDYETNRQIHIELETEEKNYIHSSTFKISLSVVFYENGYITDRKIIIGEYDEFYDNNIAPKYIELWSDLTGIMLNINNYRQQVQDAINNS